MVGPFLPVILFCTLRIVIGSCSDPSACAADVGRDTISGNALLQVHRPKRSAWRPPSCSTLVPHENLQLLEVVPTHEDSSLKTSEKFQRIYDTNYWQPTRDGSVSGAGSSIDSTKALCQIFQQTAMKILNDKQKKGAALSLNVLDAPSGDWFWMPSCLHALDAILPDGASVYYQGLDVAYKAVALAEGARKKFKSKSIKVDTFQIADLSNSEALHSAVNNVKFDIILCHDALQHNPTSQVEAILRNFNALGKYLVVDIDRVSNNFLDIEPGGYRQIDLTKPPYALKPLCADENVLQNKDPYMRKSESEWFGVFQLPVAVRY